MNRQQKLVLDYLNSNNRWTTSKEITAKTGVKAPRMIVFQLRQMGYEIRSHQAGQNSLGYLFGRELERGGWQDE